MDKINVFTIAAALAHRRGQFGATLISLTPERRLLKRPWKAAGHAGWEVFKVSKWSNFGIGWSYSRVVQARATPPASAPTVGQFSVPTPEYIPAPASGMEVVEGYDDLLYRATKDPEKFYLRVYQTPHTSVKMEYVLHQPGWGYTPVFPEMDIESFLSAPPPASAKQSALGIAEEDQVKPRAFGCDSLLGFHFGDIAFGVDDIHQAMNALFNP